MPSTLMSILGGGNRHGTDTGIFGLTFYNGIRYNCTCSACAFTREDGYADQVEIADYH